MFSFIRAYFQCLKPLFDAEPFGDMALYKARAEALREIVDDSSGIIDVPALKKLCFQGIPDEIQMRPLCWRILLNYLPTKRSEWKTFLSQQRTLYDSLVVDLIVKSIRRDSTEDGDESDHPLNLNPNSEWSAFFKDNEILMQINKDVRRLCPEIGFFHKATEFPSKAFMESELDPLGSRVANDILSAEVLTKNRSGASNLVTSSKKVAAEQYVALSEKEEAHWQVVERILFIYSKLNPGVKYVQGMNEILGPIYYVFASDTDAAWREHAEADAFFCFQYLMSEIKDNFIKTLDSSSCGIEYRMNRLYELLQEIDPEVFQKLSVEQEVLPQYYAFRWLSLLLSQEFPLPDVIRLWDSLFSDPERFEYFLYVCLAMITNVRDQILTNDFSTNVRLVQNYPSVDVANILTLAVDLKTDLEERRKKQTVPLPKTLKQRFFKTNDSEEKKMIF